MKDSGSQCVRSGCETAGGGDTCGVPGGETCSCGAAGPCSTDEMGYGLVVLWLAVMVFFLGVAGMWSGLAFEGYGMMAVSALGLLRAARHMAEAGRLAKAEDERRQQQWDEWAAKVAGGGK